MTDVLGKSDRREQGSQRNKDKGFCSLPMELPVTIQRTSGPQKGFTQFTSLSDLSLMVRPGTSGVIDAANES